MESLSKEAMVPPDLSDSAQAFAYMAHISQVEKTGQPYWAHLVRVAARTDQCVRAVAWLHDVMEDTATTREDLLERGIAEWVVDSVEVVSRVDETYDEFIERIILSGNIPAIVVKAADLADHLRPGCDNVLSLSHMHRYRRAIDRMELTLHRHGVAHLVDLTNIEEVKS